MFPALCQFVLIVILLIVSEVSAWRMSCWFRCSFNAVSNGFPGVTYWSDRSHELVPSRVLPGALTAHGLTRVSLGELLGEGAGSAVYAIEGTDLVIKYKASSHSSRPYGSEMQREWAMRLIISESVPGISVRSVFLSESFSVEPSVKLTWESGLPIRVQFLISERAGASMSSLLEVRDFSLADAARIGIELIRKLRRLHLSGNIVHGDLHAGNVVAARDGRGIKLIDFGHAREAQPAARIYNQSAHMKARNCRVWYSPWEYRYEEYYSYRVDVFRAVELVALLSHGPRFHQEMWNICKDERFDDFVYIKERSNLFDIYSKGLVFPIAPSDRQEKLMRLTRSLSTAIRAPSSPTEIPAYETLIDILSKIVRMFGRTDDLVESMEFNFY
jgi:serine/threonine protein kinase